MFLPSQFKHILPWSQFFPQRSFFWGPPYSFCHFESKGNERMGVETHQRYFGSPYRNLFADQPDSEHDVAFLYDRNMEYSTITKARATEKTDHGPKGLERMILYRHIP